VLASTAAGVVVLIVVAALGAWYLQARQKQAVILPAPSFMGTEKIHHSAPTPLLPEMPANRRDLALGCLSCWAELSKKAAKYRIEFGRLPLFIE
jgi:hypothetical protein